MACLRNSVNGLLCFRALGRFSECQDNMSFHVQKWPDISNGWSDKPSKKEAKKKERKKKGGRKREGRGGGEEERIKYRKERGSTVLGLDPSALVYIYI